MPVDSSLLSAILGSAGAGTALIVIMLLTGVLSTRQYTGRIEKECEYWKSAFTAERELSGAKEKAVAAAVERADAAVEVAKLTKELLQDLRRRTDAASPKAP